MLYGIMQYRSKVTILGLLTIIIAGVAIMIRAGDGKAPIDEAANRHLINTEPVRAAEGYADKGETAEAAAHDNKEHSMQKATFAAGCFWGVEEAFRTLKGVMSTSVGYTGGHTENPTYRQVCSDVTGHAEAVRIEFDPAVVTYDELLAVFWNVHDPTQVNRQGPDVGSQYRSVIFYHSPEQKLAAEQSKQRLESSGKLSRPVATEIVEAGQYYPAEDYHQQYLHKRGLGASCHN
jgi:peptide-methionine (S)-S-oxide reductase